jgi:hypothetical protein
MVTLADFNKTLKGAIDRAKVIEKNDPAGSIDVWIKIAEYALAFARKQSDLTLRRMIEQRVEGIIQRVKRIKDELKIHAAPTPPTTERETTELPSVPKGAPAAIPPPPSGQNAAKLQATLGQLKKETPATPEGKSIQDWLMAVPDGFKEIPAAPVPGATPPVIGSSGGKKAGDGGELTPAQQYFKELADKAEAEEKKAGTNIDPAKDPFAKANIPQEIPPDKRVCFACGMLVEKNAKFCPYCGTA